MAYLILPPLPQLPARVWSLCVRLTLPHRSVGTGSTKLGLAGHSIDVSAAQAMTGGVVSWTEIVWLHELLLPHSSVATQVRLIAYLILPPLPQLPAKVW